MTTTTTTTTTEDKETKTLLRTLLDFENLLCRTSTAWGLLEGKEPAWLLVWWLLRHSIYFGIAIVLLLYVPSSVIPVTVFILAAHVYKAVRHAILFVGQAKDNTRRRRRQQAMGSRKKDKAKGVCEEERVVDDDVEVCDAEKGAEA